MLATTSVFRDGLLGRPEVAHRELRAGGRAADEDRVDAEEGGATGPVRDGPAADRARELGRDVVEERDVRRADRGPVAGDVADLGSIIPMSLS